MSVGMSLAALSFCLCRLSVSADTNDGTGRLVLDPTALPVGIRRFAVERDSTGIQTLQRDLLMNRDAQLRVAYTMARPPEDQVQKYPVASRQDARVGGFVASRSRARLLIGGGVVVPALVVARVNSCAVRACT